MAVDRKAPQGSVDTKLNPQLKPQTEPKQSPQPGNLALFDAESADRIAYAFGEQTHPEPLLRLLFVQMRALCSICGISFANKDTSSGHLDVSLGQSLRHSANYNLTFRDEDIGSLTLYHARILNDHELQTAEDLISLALPALRNSLVIYRHEQSELGSQATGLADGAKATPITLTDSTANLTLSADEKIALAEVASSSSKDKADTLILVALDGFYDFVERDGEEWAHILMTSVHQQIYDGLRSADSIYHIGNDQIAVLLPQTTSEQALQVATKIRTLVASLHLLGNEFDNQLTASMGISSSRHASSADGVMQNARQALQRAQSQGTNNIVEFSCDNQTKDQR